MQAECFHCALQEPRAEPPIYDCARNWRWQVKWLTCPLGLLIQGCRTRRHRRWYCTLHVTLEVRWGKSLRWKSEILPHRLQRAFLQFLLCQSKVANEEKWLRVRENSTLNMSKFSVKHSWVVCDMFQVSSRSRRTKYSFSSPQKWVASVGEESTKGVLVFSSSVLWTSEVGFIVCLLMTWS